MKIGFLGVGLMGGAMATVLLSRGFSLKVFDLDPQKVSALVAKGAEAAGSPAEAATDVDLLCTSLPNGQILRDVYLGSGQALAGVAPGTVLVDFSTTEPAALRTLHEAASQRGVHVVDSPISGGPGEVLRQEAILLVGATDEAFRKAEPVLRVLSGGADRIFRLGEVGTGKVVKLVNNVSTYCNVVIGAEAFVLGVKAGVEPARLYRLLSAGEGKSFQFVKRIALALQRDFVARGTVHLAIKDLGMALALGRELGCPMPLAAAVQQLYLAAAGKGFGSDDYLSVLRLYEQWAGVEVGAREEGAAPGGVARADEVRIGEVAGLANNVMVMNSVAAVAETLTVGVKAGVDPARLHALLCVCAGRSDPLIERFPYALSRDFHARLSMAAGIRELGRALALAEEVGCLMPATAMVQQLYRAAAAEGHGEEDVVAVIKLFEGWAAIS